MRVALREQWLTRPALARWSDGRWLVATSVTVPTKNPAAACKVQFSTVPGGDRVASLTGNQLFDDDSLTRVAPQVVFGMLGGDFSGEDGNVRVSSLIGGAKGITKVKYSAVKEDGAIGGTARTVALEEFLRLFPPKHEDATPSDGAAPGEDNATGRDRDDVDRSQVDLKDHAKLLAAFRIVGIVPSESTIAAKDSLLEVVSAILARTVAAGELSNILGKLEAIAAAPSSAAFAKLDELSTSGHFTRAPLVLRSLSVREKIFAEADLRSVASGAAKRKRNGKEPAEPASGQGVHELDDSDSGSSDPGNGSDAEDGAAPDGASGSAGPSAGSGARDRPRPPHGTARQPKQPRPARARLIDQVSPSGMAPLDAAAIVFETAQAREMASCAEVPPDSSMLSSDRLQQMETRYDFALNRLKNKLARLWIEPDVQTEEDLFKWAEAIVDAVATRRESDANRSSSKRPADSAIYLEDFEEAKRPDTGLASAEKRASATVPDVAFRLHSDAAPLTTLHQSLPVGDGGTRDFISTAPANLRGDLRRALSSNSLVDAQGETDARKRALPPCVLARHRCMQGEIERAIMRVPQSDSTGELSLKQSAASTLALGVIEGSADMGTFQKAAQAMYGSRASTPDSYAALVEAWSLARPAYGACMSAIGESTGGLEAVNMKITAPRNLAQLPPKQLAEWCNRVLNAYNVMKHIFRKGGDQMDMLRCVSQMEANYQFKALMHAASSAKQASPTPAGTVARPRNQPKHAPGNKRAAASPPAANAPPAGAPNPPAASAAGPRSSVSGWTERANVLDEATFNNLRAKAKDKYPQHCTFWLIAKCGRAACKFQHAPRPADFEQFLTDNRLKIDGSAICARMHEHARSRATAHAP